MKKLYQKGLIHGDLSQFNILNYNEDPIFIDFSQATTTEASNAEELLKRDIKNICHYFHKNFGLKDAVEEKVLKKILA